MRYLKCSLFMDLSNSIPDEDIRSWYVNKNSNNNTLSFDNIYKLIYQSSIGDDYKKIAAKRIVKSIIYLSDLCKDNDNILDIGGSDEIGKIISQSIKKNISYKYINQTTIDIRKEKLPYDDNQFDIVISWETIEHLWVIVGDGLLGWDGVKNFWRECHRVLRDGGLFFLTTTNRFCPRILRTFCLGILPHIYPAENLCTGHVREFSARDFRNITTSLNMFQENRIFSENVYNNAYEVGAYDIDYKSDDFLVWEQKMETMIGRSLKPEEKGDTLFFVGNKQ